MKELKAIFKNKSIVRPLYKKVVPTCINIDNIYKLDGPEFEIKRKIGLINKNDLPGTCDNVRKSNIKNNNVKQMFGNVNAVCAVNKKDNTMAGFVQDRWLRVFPSPKLPNESAGSVIFRCVFCQLGIATFLILWTVIWVFVIHSFEGPHEIEVSLKFEKEQNQLVIDLATELRQITPISPSWRNAIEKRMEDERQLTITAIGRGVRIHPGQFWNLPGTFLFTIYVMSALGFGAPVPQTVWGRTCVIIYAFLAVPLHIYLMVNMSTCLVSNISRWIGSGHKQRRYNDERQNQRKESPNNSRNSEINRNGNFIDCIRKQLKNILSIICACHCVPFAAIAYYVCGALLFGVMRNKEPIDVVMFPLEFTTTGGLEQVEGYVRVIYGLYVGGAMVLISCALATLRHHSTTKMHSIAEKYRLFKENVDT